MKMKDLPERYNRVDKPQPLCPLDIGTVLVEVRGLTEEVSKAVNFLAYTWTLSPSSTVEWETVDGAPPEVLEPCAARMLMRIRDVKKEASSPDEGTAKKAKALQSLVDPVA